MYHKVWRVGISRPSVFLFITEAIIIHLSVFFSVILRFPGEFFRFPHLLPNVLIIGISLSVALYYAEAYTTYLYIQLNQFFLLKFILQAVVISYIVLCVFYYIFPSFYLGRGILLINFILVTTSLYVWRIVFPWIAPKVGLTRKAVILGDSKAGRSIQKIVLMRENTGFEITDTIPIDTELKFESVMAGLEKQGAKTVITTTVSLEKLPFDFLWQFQLQGYQLIDAVTFHEWLTGKVSEQNVTAKNFLFFYNPNKLFFSRLGKRAMDVLISFLLIIATLPLQVLIALVVKITSSGPILYKQTRTGLFDKPFVIYKYRTMRADAEKHSGPKWAEHKDPRITSIGRFLRITRFDELPQVFNVLRGEMSIIGPRPERPVFTEIFNKEIPFYHLRHSVRPGITGWAQVSYAYASSIEETSEKLRYDLYYIKNFSLTLDLIIILKTVKTLVTGQGAK